MGFFGRFFGGAAPAGGGSWSGTAPLTLGPLQLEIQSGRVFKRGDTWPPFKAQLTVGGAALDLSQASSVRFLASGPKTIFGYMAVTDAAKGEVRYLWAPLDLDTPGLYQVEVEVVFTDGVILTAPSSGYREIEVIGDLG